MQETFLVALKARHKFSQQSSERTWLVGILKHKIVDHFRRASRERPVANFEASSNDDDLFQKSGEWIGHWTQESAPKEWANDPSEHVRPNMRYQPPITDHTNRQPITLSTHASQFSMNHLSCKKNGA